MDLSVPTFYDRLAPDYHLIFANYFPAESGFYQPIVTARRSSV